MLHVNILSFDRNSYFFAFTILFYSHLIIKYLHWSQRISKLTSHINSSIMSKVKSILWYSNGNFGFYVTKQTINKWKKRKEEEKKIVWSKIRLMLLSCNNNKKISSNRETQHSDFQYEWNERVCERDWVKFKYTSRI